MPHQLGACESGRIPEGHDKARPLKRAVKTERRTKESASIST